MIGWQTIHRQKASLLRCSPAVGLPDSGGHIRPDCPQDIFIDITHLHDLENRLLDIFAHRKSHADARNSKMGGKRAVEALVQLLVPTRSLQPRITDLFAQENRKIEELTQQQFKILNILRYQKRTAIIGGAGTGKTLLAIEKAAQLAESGLRVLFVCYNTNLAKWISGRLQHPRVDVFTFHALVGHMINRARIPMPRTRSWDEFDAIAPDALVDALGVLHAPDADPTLLYDAIIVDEGQDFEDTWWIGLLDTLKDAETGVFYVFFDDNQRIFTQLSQVPMEIRHSISTKISATRSIFTSGSSPIPAMPTFNVLDHRVARWRSYRSLTKSSNAVSFSGSYTDWSTRKVFR